MDLEVSRISELGKSIPRGHYSGLRVMGCGREFTFRYYEVCVSFKYDPSFPISGLYYDKQNIGFLGASNIFPTILISQYSGRLSRSSSTSLMGPFNDAASISTIIDQGDEPETVKIRLQQWVQVVACSVRQFSGEPN
ncbi:hypothetical protein CRYUN_Cryun05aG0141800 [Craigia yunnanensis]